MASIEIIFYSEHVLKYILLGQLKYPRAKFRVECTFNNILSRRELHTC